MSKHELPVGVTVGRVGLDEPAIPAALQPQIITMDAAALQAMIKSAADAAVALAMAGAAVPSVDNFEKAMAHIRGQDRPASDLRRFACVSPLTGATFVAVVHFNSRNPRGRCLYLEEYAEPAGVWKNAAEGGLYPEDAPIFQVMAGEAVDAGGKVSLVKRQLRTQGHKTWMWENFYKRDLAEYGGKPFQPYTTVEATEKRATTEAGFAPKPIAQAAE